MTWVRLDDQFPDHPKIAALGDDMAAAGWLHVCGLCYCGRYLTDGVVPAAQAFRLTGMDKQMVKHLLERLVDVCLWENTPSGDYQIHDYLDFNPSREESLALQSHRRSAGQAGGQASAKARAQAKSKPVPVPLELPLPPHEQKWLEAMARIPGFEVVDPSSELKYLRGLAGDFPNIDLEDTIKQMAAWLIDRPSASKNPNYHSRLRNFCKRAKPQSPPATRLSDEPLFRKGAGDLAYEADRAKYGPMEV